MLTQSMISPSRLIRAESRKVPKVRMQAAHGHLSLTGSIPALAIEGRHVGCSKEGAIQEQCEEGSKKTHAAPPGAIARRGEIIAWGKGVGGKEGEERKQGRNGWGEMSINEWKHFNETKVKENVAQRARVEGKGVACASSPGRGGERERGGKGDSGRYLYVCREGEVLVWVVILGVDKAGEPRE